MKLVLPFLLFLHVWKAKQQPTGQPSEETCCKNKTVGDYGYILVSEGDVPSACKSRCIYAREDDPASRYCFAPGQDPVNCGGIFQMRCWVGWRFIGPVIRRTTTPGFQECNDLCYDQQGCSFFAHDKNGGECILLSGRDAELGTPGWISG